MLASGERETTLKAGFASRDLSVHSRTCRITTRSTDPPYSENSRATEAINCASTTTRRRPHRHHLAVCRTWPSHPLNDIASPRQSATMAEPPIGIV
jgi:hypothetical protein